jgi:hypothetical protein
VRSILIFNCQRSNHHQRGPKKDTPGRLSKDFRIHKLEKCSLVGRETISILQDSEKFVLHIRSEVKLEKFVNSVLVCFTKVLF